MHTKDTLSVIKNNRQESFSSRFKRQKIISPPPKPPGYKFKPLNVNYKGSSDEDDDEKKNENDDQLNNKNQLSPQQQHNNEKHKNKNFIKLNK